MVIYRNDILPSPWTRCFPLPPLSKTHLMAKSELTEVSMGQGSCVTGAGSKSDGGANWEKVLVPFSFALR
jgi:hypothetical protein